MPDQGLEKEKSALEGFAVKYNIPGIPGLIPEQFFDHLYETLKDFLTYHRNIKLNMILVCMMEKQNIQQNIGVIGLEESKAYFFSGTFKNVKSTDVDELIERCKESIIAHIENYRESGSGWYFKEVDKLEIILLNIIQQRAHLTFLFRIGYQIKKQLLILKTKMKNAFFGVYLDIFIQKKYMKKD